MNLVQETCLSHPIIGRRIDDLGDNIEGTLKDKLSACVLYTLALDESTDQSDTAQLVIFIRGIDENFNIIEEMLDLCQIKGTATGKDIYEFVNLSLDKFNIDRKNIYSITTDDALTSPVALQLRAPPKVSARAPAHRSYHFRGVKLKSCIKKIHHNFYISKQANVRIKHADTEGASHKKFGTDARVQ